MKALLFGIGLLLPLENFAALSADNGANQRLSPHESQNTPRQGNTLARLSTTGFDDRWTSRKQEYAIGSGGVLSKLQDSDDITNLDNRIGDIRDQKELSISDGYITNTVMLKSGDAPSASETASNITSLVSECGPSPLGPDEIRDLVEQAAHRHSVDATFAAAVAFAESRFDQSRNSDKGARGPMQLMPDTASRFGVQDICDPADNIEGGIKYIRALLDEFQNPVLAAAAYNAGEKRIYEYGGIPPFRETINYVASVINYQISQGMPLPKKSRARQHAKPSFITANGNETGVIAVRKTSSFVGGVMHF